MCSVSYRVSNRTDSSVEDMITMSKMLNAGEAVRVKVHEELRENMDYKRDIVSKQIIYTVRTRRSVPVTRMIPSRRHYIDLVVP